MNIHSLLRKRKKAATENREASTTRIFEGMMRGILFMNCGQGFFVRGRVAMESCTTFAGETLNLRRGGTRPYRGASIRRLDGQISEFRRVAAFNGAQLSDGEANNKVAWKKLGENS